MDLVDSMLMNQQIGHLSAYKKEQWVGLLCVFFGQKITAAHMFPVALHRSQVD